ncbi:MAG: glycerophosphodiester phosphodiesterase [Proteobacteria bacterium]|nr:glycerophosphodiester phosphodiesterase [Pseudomonadota bacterium]
MLELPRIMGHRGAAGRAPENTLAGLRAAADMGATWVEFDVMLTKDRVPVLFHDDNLKRTTRREALMVETPFAELSSVEAGAWFAPKFAGEPVPSLEMALALALQLGLTPNVEIKPTAGQDEATAAAALEVIACCWPAGRPGPLISSFSRASLEVARRQAPDLPRALIAWRLPRDWSKAAEALACCSLHIAGNRLNAKRVARIKAAGYALAAFTVNEPKVARKLLGWGVDCIITDKPDTIAKAIA